MKIKKAVEILEQNVLTSLYTADQDYLDAARLGIEALKRLKEGRQGHTQGILGALPRETKD